MKPDVTQTEVKMIKIVVIDDEFMVVEGIRALIAREPECEVTGWAYDGISGLDVIRENMPDIVITDIRIPGIDGLSLIEAAQDFCPDTAFIVISGYMEFEYARRALSLGVKGYIDKPISRSKLNEVLARIRTEWQQNRNPGSEDSLRKRRMYEKLDSLQEKSVRLLTERDPDAFKETAGEVMETMEIVYPDLTDLRRETYKYLCLVGDILTEENPAADREDLASFREMEKQMSREQIRSYAFRILREVERNLKTDNNGSSHRIIRELMDYIDAHYQEDIGLNELSARVRMNTAYLSVLFKAEAGMSFIKYLTGLRLKKAKALLKEGYKVKEVSDLVGYSNYRYFCDIFKKHIGQTPQEYKDSHTSKST